ncbi:MAG: hypothetical protein IT436_17245 [Phycisphaerales bacterium]|nr:hypothetical protein [Phycisphaerales bacterium]
MNPADAIVTLAAAPTNWPGSFNLPTWLAPVLATAGILLGITIIIIQIRSDRRRAGRAAHAQPAAQPGTSTPQAGPLRDVIRDAEELIDRLAARADSQAQRLEALIHQASAAERRLSEAQARAAAAPPQPAAAPNAQRHPTASRPAAAQPQLEPKPAARAASHDPLEAAHNDVYDLADQGLPPGEIAKRLGAPKGEIELILSLRRL